ncbi:MAG: hypothetical protein L3J59_15260 [Methylococcaceae bacterium]|nr:hypothetical protein [Methylococcaceae bacterium]
MHKKYNIFHGLILLLVATNLYANADSNDCKVTTPLNSNQWQLIGIPCKAPAGTNTVEAIFSDDIDGDYGVDWKLISYNSEKNSYDDVDIQDELQIGTGYWIISFSDQTLLDMPAGSQPVTQKKSTQCTQSSCFEKTLISNSSNQSQLISNPFHYSFSWSALRGKTALNDSTCGDTAGCTLEEMQTAGFVENQGWYYDGKKYISLKETEVSPWMGIWIRTLDAASSAHKPTLLFPGLENTPNPNPNPNPNPSDQRIFHLNFSQSPLGNYTHSDIKRDWPGVRWSEAFDRVKVVNESNNRFIRVNYPKGGVGPENGGAIWKVDFSDAFGTTYNELYISYKIRFAKNFNPVKGGKLPGLWGGDGNTNGKKATGYDGWSARMMWRAKTTAIFYVYSANMKNTWGDVNTWGKDETIQFPANEWVQVEQRIVMNSPSDNNGILQGWYNGVLELDKRDMRYRKVNSFAIDGFYFSTFFGGEGSQWAPTRNETIDFDDFIFSTEPITH